MADLVVAEGGINQVRKGTYSLCDPLLGPASFGELPHSKLFDGLLFCRTRSFSLLCLLFDSINIVAALYIVQIFVSTTILEG
jgi:hypothetical protein